MGKQEQLDSKLSDLQSTREKWDADDRKDTIVTSTKVKVLEEIDKDIARTKRLIRKLIKSKRV